MGYRYRRQVLRRLDQLVIGADPRKLKQQTEVPSSTPKQAVPLSDKERGRLAQLNSKRLYDGPLTPEEAYEQTTLQARKGAQ